MTYDQARDTEQQGKLQAAIAEFVNRYKTNTANPKLLTRKTVILFPGGMGSHLVRARKSYNASMASYSYDTSWLDCSVLTGAVNDLKMQNDIDSSNRFVVADGPVDFAFLGLTPYADFIDWCDERGIDWFIFGWDWRRKLEHSVDMFLGWFLGELQAQVRQVYPTDNPLADFTIIGHSFGGMVVKLIANQYNNNFVTTMKNAVTVGSPFYGHGGHVHRYFEGDPDLPIYSKSDVTRAVSSMLGGYTLLYLDLATYNTVGRALSNDPQYPLDDYPVKDATDGSNVDPYNPLETTKKFRYPQKYGFNYQALNDGLQIYRQVAQVLDQTILPRFYNIRGVQAQGNNITNGTVCTQTWKLIPKSFNPDLSFLNPAIVDETYCPGDGVIPAWSARLLCTPQANVRTFVGDFKHMNLMNLDEIHDELAGIIQLQPVQAMMIVKHKAPRRTPRRRRQPRIATFAELRSFQGGLEKISKRYPDGVKREQAVRGYLAKFDLPKLRELMGRAFEDALKSPSQKLGIGPRKPQRPPSRKSRAPRKRSKAD